MELNIERDEVATLRFENKRFLSEKITKNLIRLLYE
jgi:hypothetical protein